MCGLVGLVDLAGLDPNAVMPRLERAVARIHPRGPDDQGTWLDDHAALGHTRLAIVDLSPAGHQPMRLGDLALAYNGEIYNHRELRCELEAEGVVFRGQSDTEVLIHAWAHWGADVLPRLNGMFAFVIVDRVRGELFAARDRFGIKPLYYWHSPAGVLAFASEIKQFTVLPGWRATLDGA